MSVPPPEQSHCTVFSETVPALLCLILVGITTRIVRLNPDTAGLLRNESVRW